MRSGIDREGADLTVRPQDDLFGHVNGRWLATAEIPADRGRFGTFDLLRDQSEERLSALLTEAGDGVVPGPIDAGADVRGAVGALYASMLDEAAVAARGLAPLTELLDEIAAVTSQAQLWNLMGRLQRLGVTGAVRPVVSTDDRDPEHYVVYLDQSGLGLPDEAYYREASFESVRKDYLAHVERLVGAATAGHTPNATVGDSVDASASLAASATATMALETALAAHHWDRVTTRDSVKTYTKVDFGALVELAPNVPWAEWVAGLGAPSGAFDHVIARQPSYLTSLSESIAAIPLSAWQAWLAWQTAHAFAPYLPDALVEEDFAFYGRILSGTPEQRVRWKRATALVDLLVGEAAGRLYVERHFPPEAKDRMLHLVENLVEAYRRDITDLEWMSPATREKALEKLSLFTPKIAYPDTWRDYAGLLMDSADLFGNVSRGFAHDTDRDFAKLSGPVDRGEWFMAPHVVNAYYNPGMNEIVFPAAILQPPFFDPEADDAVNYGAIGSVIGHEIGHGFDDQGSRFDGTGRLVDWWTEDDRRAFDELGARLIAQYDAFEPRDLPGEHVNGALTVGENIGDLGGVTIAHLAYRISLGDSEAPVLDGLTGDQRFFEGWAQIWRMKARPEEAKRLLSVDPHSPGEFRANIVRNLHEFDTAYGLVPGDGLWLPEEERIRIW